MITRQFEPFTLLEEEITLRGVVSYVPVEDMDPRGFLVLRAEPVLLHESDVTLCPGDLIRRERDGRAWQIAARSEPAPPGLHWSQTPLKNPKEESHA